MGIAENFLLYKNENVLHFNHRAACGGVVLTTGQILIFFIFFKPIFTSGAFAKQEEV
jgi:hypothetical protein